MPVFFFVFLVTRREEGDGLLIVALSTLLVDFSSYDKDSLLLFHLSFRLFFKNILAFHGKRSHLKSGDFLFLNCVCCSGELPLACVSSMRFSGLLWYFMYGLVLPFPCTYQFPPSLHPLLSRAVPTIVGIPPTADQV